MIDKELAGQLLASEKERLPSVPPTGATELPGRKVQLCTLYLLCQVIYLT